MGKYRRDLSSDKKEFWSRLFL